MTDILLAVDGTGAWSNEDYRRDMQNSFVSRIYRGMTGVGGVTKFYHRGPSLTGVESSLYGLSTFFDYLSSLSTSSRSQPINIYLTGYSRGAMIAIYVANRIHQYNTLNGFYASSSNAVRRSLGFATNQPLAISIAGIILFDAVDSDLTMWGSGISTIPDSCSRATHFICKQSSTLLPRSRWYFNRIELRCEPPEKLTVLEYDCTHAAIGGLPGTGDHRTPTTGTGVLASGLAGAAQTQQSLSPNVTALRMAGNFAADAVGTAWDAVKSNITYEEDMRVYERVNAEVRRRLANDGWPVAF